jgi:galactose mutarotase-like enzyme
MFAGTTERLDLEDDRRLRLSRDLFKIDGIFMNQIADEITLKTDKDDRFVTVKYAGFPYLGIWQEYGADTPFICVEPWCGLPDYEGLSRDILKKNDMFHIKPNEAKTVSYSIIFG